MINKQTQKNMKNSAYKIETFNNGTLFAVIMDCGNGYTEICSSYYKTIKSAEKMLNKCRYWAGEINNK